MIAYLDASVLLRVVLGQPNKLKEWSQIEAAVASALVEVECLRMLDRLRLRGAGFTEQAIKLFTEVAEYNFNSVGYALVRNAAIKKLEEAAA